MIVPYVLLYVANTKPLENCDSEIYISAIIITGGSSMLGVTTESQVRLI